jgi:ubiquinone/menaquinone biosynthesis C-methylase UbiE
VTAVPTATLRVTRAAYDTVAVDYARLLDGSLAGSATDRAVLGLFAELVGRGRTVADLGCGPGRLVGHLEGLGLHVVGLDLSWAMLEVGRRTHPGVGFVQGSLTALPFADGALAGALAWYSLIHLPPQALPLAAAELARVLAPGAQLVVAFQVGDEVVRHDNGHPVALDSYRRPLGTVADALATAGLEVHTRLLREPAASSERTQQGYLLARRS